jgi:hypothetical protein
LKEFVPPTLQEEKMMYAGADWMDPSGRLPLHIAIEAGKTWSDGIEALIHAFPQSICITDRSTKLYPYQLSATKATQSELSMNDCFELLRCNPTVLSGGNDKSSATSRCDVDVANPMTTTNTEESATPTTDTTSSVESTCFSTDFDNDEFVQRKRRKS